MKRFLYRMGWIRYDGSPDYKEIVLDAVMFAVVFVAVALVLNQK
jgi:hypothetical protein